MLAHCQSYKEALKHLIEDRKKKFGKTYNYQNIADSCRIQKAYFSRVLNADAHLSDDQLYLALARLEASAQENEFVTLLHQWERSGVASRQETLQTQVEETRQSLLSSSHGLDAESPQWDDANISDYYLDCRLQLIHVGMSIDRFAKHPGLLRDALGLDAQKFSVLMLQLERLRMIERIDGTYRITQRSLNLSRQSPLYPYHLRLLRLAVLQKIESADASRTYQYSVLFSADEETRKLLHGMFQDFLGKAQKLVGNAPADDIYYLGIDLFPWLSS